MKKDTLKDAVILITGGTGSWGQVLTYNLLKNHSPKEIRIYSRGEHAQVMMKRTHINNKIKYIIGDVRDKHALTMVTRGVDVLFHLAALKHVPVCEENPWEAVMTNIVGTQNVIDASIENGIKKIVDVSTDKAVDPLNMYGLTKVCAERLIIAANLINSKSSFVCIRGGNVIGTKGSVVPLFKEQITKLNEVTITVPAMTRFFMSLEEAIGLVLKAAVDSVGGEIFVMKMSSCKITDLADVMIQRMGKKTTKKREIGIRPGEKLHEVLISQHESERTYQYDDYFLILPQIPLEKTQEYYLKKKLKKVNFSEFSSNNKQLMTRQKIEKLLNKDKWFDANTHSESLFYLQSISDKNLRNIYKSEGWMK